MEEIVGLWEVAVDNTDFFEQAFYLEPLTASESYLEESISSQWVSSGSPTEEVLSRYTIVSLQCEQVCNTVLNDAVINPCSIIQGSANTVFRINLQPNSYPDQYVRWSSPLAGISFQSGNVGREVRLVSNLDEECDGRLCVNVGSDSDAITCFSLTAGLPPKTVKLCPYVVADEEDSENFDYHSLLLNMLPTINRIYSQVGVQFVVDANVVTITNSKYLDIDINDASLYALSAEMMSGDGVPICFIRSLSDRYSARKIGGYCTGSSVLVVSSAVTPQIIAHELGHAAGLRDIYDCDVSGAVLHNALAKPALPDDWSGDDNIGYYGSEMTQGDVIRRLLMCGTAGEDHIDIPCGRIKGYSYALRYESLGDPNPRYVSTLGMIQVGLKDLNRDFTGEGNVDEDE